MKTFCGLDCEECMFKTECAGCVTSGGKPFGEQCPVAECCVSNKHEYCGECKESPCALRQKIIDAFNALGIKDMPKITSLNVLKGSYVNLEYTLPSGQKVTFLDDNKLYFGNQVEKNGSERCYGIIADKTFLLVSEYGKEGTDPEVVVYQKRR